MKKGILIVVFCVLGSTGCGPASTDTADLSSSSSINVVATTNLVGDLVRSIGGDHVNVTSLMGPGIDPHLYKASEGDVARMAGADVIVYAGLHLEGKMVEIFEQMGHRGKETVAVSDGIQRTDLIESEAFGGNYDPHIWFDVALWKDAARNLAERLTEINAINTESYAANLDGYLSRLDSTDVWVRSTIGTLPVADRVLITSHDAFGYFGRAYEFEVYGLQGISTVSEAGTGDVQNLSTMVAERRIPSMFVESSVPPRGIEAVRQAVRAKGFDVRIGGSLFSDALGALGTPEGEYTGMVRFNVSTIVNGLKSDD